MKNKNILIRICILLIVLLNTKFIFSQKDTIVGITTPQVIKKLQFGNDFLADTQPEINKEIPKSLEVSEFTKYYNQKYLVYDPIRDPKRLVYNTGLYVGAAITAFGVLWVLPESISNWDKDKMREEGIFERWKENVRAGPVWDEDDWFLNYVTHPWSGAVYYMSARGSGFKMCESFVYSTLMSTFFWEYGIEAFAEIPSIQDLIVTPIVGSILGEQFFRWKGNIIRNDKKLLNSRFMGRTSIFLMDPFNQILDGLGYMTKNKIQTYSIIAPIDYDFSTGKSIWGLQVVMIF